MCTLCNAVVRPGGRAKAAVKGANRPNTCQQAVGCATSGPNRRRNERHFSLCTPAHHAGCTLSCSTQPGPRQPAALTERCPTAATQPLPGAPSHMLHGHRRHGLSPSCRRPDACAAAPPSPPRPWPARRATRPLLLNPAAQPSPAAATHAPPRCSLPASTSSLAWLRLPTSTGTVASAHQTRSGQIRR